MVDCEGGFFLEGICNLCGKLITEHTLKVAVDAALQAAKEAVSKQNKSSALAIERSEASTIKPTSREVAIYQRWDGVLRRLSDIEDDSA